jgi:hypothetical protein
VVPDEVVSAPMGAIQNSFVEPEVIFNSLEHITKVGTIP